MKKSSFAFFLFILGLQAGAIEVRQLPIDFTLRNVQLTDGMIAYGSALFTWPDWLKRPTSGPLMIASDFNKNDLEVFEARSAGYVKKPISFFTNAYLHNIETIRKLNPQNQHQQIKDHRFVVETTIPFPPAWADLIAMGKRTTLLDGKTTDHIKMTSVFAIARKADIDRSAPLKKTIQLLDITGQTPEIINFQGTTKVNQIADTISIVTFLYPAGPQRTLVVNYMAVTLKKHLLRKGVDARGVRLTGRSLLMGENTSLNSDKGIGAGLPKYALEFFTGMMQGMEAP